MHGILVSMLDRELLSPDHARPITRDEFERMVADGMFDDDDHLELLRGVLVTMSPQGEPHARITAWLGAKLVRELDDTYEIRQHTSYAATEDSVPEPDVQVLERALRRRLPRTTLLLIEVSESTLRKDTMLKPSIYSENRCPEYWVVDIKSRLVWVHSEPGRDGYERVERYDRSMTLRPREIPGIEIRVADIPWLPTEDKRSRRRPR
jgi:Uma2 family endonuclease